MTRVDQLNQVRKWVFDGLYKRPVVLEKDLFRSYEFIDEVSFMVVEHNVISLAEKNHNF